MSRKGNLGRERGTEGQATLAQQGDPVGVLFRQHPFHGTSLGLLLSEIRAKAGRWPRNVSC